jgi:hypothetical protein
MCPACLTTLALTVVGATSTGGVVALREAASGEAGPEQRTGAPAPYPYGRSHGELAVAPLRRLAATAAGRRVDFGSLRPTDC